jgi:hypothetical protein
VAWLSFIKPGAKCFESATIITPPQLEIAEIECQNYWHPQLQCGSLARQLSENLLPKIEVPFRYRNFCETIYDSQNAFYRSMLVCIDLGVVQNSIGLLKCVELRKLVRGLEVDV